MITSNDISKIDENTFFAAKNFRIEKEAFLTDHIIGGEPLFPAVIMLELMAECGHAILPAQGNIIIENFRILRRIKIHKEILLKIYAKQEANGVNIKLCADFIRKARIVRKDVVYAESFYKTDKKYKVTAKEKNYKNENLKCFSIKPEDVYALEILNLGPFFQGLDREICFSEKHFKGFIRKKSDSAFLIEPALIDACLQTGDIKNRIYNGHIVLPVGIDHLCFLKTLSTPTAHCYGVLERHAGDVSVHSFIICDEFDNIIVFASGVKQQYVSRNRFNLIEHFQKAHDRFMG